MIRMTNHYKMMIMMMITCFAIVLWTSSGSPAPEPLVCSISSARVPPGDHDRGEDDHFVDYDHGEDDLGVDYHNPA